MTRGCKFAAQYYKVQTNVHFKRNALKYKTQSFDICRKSENTRNRINAHAKGDNFLVNEKSFSMSTAKMSSKSIFTSEKVVHYLIIEQTFNIFSHIMRMYCVTYRKKWKTKRR